MVLNPLGRKFVEPLSLVNLLVLGDFGFPLGICQSLAKFILGLLQSGPVLLEIDELLLNEGDRGFG